MAKKNKASAAQGAGQFAAEINRADEAKAGIRISDAMELIDGLIWAAHNAIDDSQFIMAITLMRASLPSIGAALEAANDALGEPRIGKYVYSNDVSAGGAVLRVEGRYVDTAHH